MWFAFVFRSVARAKLRCMQKITGGNVNEHNSMFILQHIKAVVFVLSDFLASNFKSAFNCHNLFCHFYSITYEFSEFGQMVESAIKWSPSNCLKHLRQEISLSFRFHWDKLLYNGAILSNVRPEKKKNQLFIDVQLAILCPRLYVVSSWWYSLSE